MSPADAEDLLSCENCAAMERENEKLVAERDALREQVVDLELRAVAAEALVKLAEEILATRRKG